MTSEHFIKYIGDYRLHDCIIVEVKTEEDTTNVIVKSCEKEFIVLEFTGTKSLKHNRPEGMILYAISEMSEQSHYHKFVFVNSDEEDDAYLEITALEYMIK